MVDFIRQRCILEVRSITHSDGVMWVVILDGAAFIHSEDVKGWPRRKNMLKALIDSAANQRTLAAEKTVSELFWEHGVMANTGVDKDKWTGIQRVKQYLKLRENPLVEVWP